MPIPAILPLAATIGGGLLSILQQRKAARKQEEFQKETEEFQKKQIAEQEKAARQAALQRAVRGNTIFAPQPGELPPSAPDLTGEQTLSGVGQALAGIGATGLSRLPQGATLFGQPGLQPLTRVKMFTPQDINELPGMNIVPKTLPIV